MSPRYDKNRCMAMPYSVEKEKAKTLIQELCNENIDLLIDYTIDEKVINSYPLLNETILLCVPKHIKANLKLSTLSLNSEDIKNDKHLLDDIKKITLKDFKNECFLMMKGGNSMNYHGFKICQEAGFTPETSIYFDQLMTSYNMSAAGLGICFVTDTLVKEVAPNNNLFFYKIDSEYSKRTVYLLSKKKRYLNRVIKEFINIATEVYKDNLLY